IGRLFSTAAYAQRIALADRATAERALEQIRAAHAAVERQRGASIPDWAHRDVLYLLVDYSERAFHAFHRPLTAAEQRELWEVFRQVGTGLLIPGLPETYAGWRADRTRHLERDLAFSQYTAALYTAYRQHLGGWRYRLLLQLQAALVPDRVRQLLDLPRHTVLRQLLPLYPRLAGLGLRSTMQRVLIPAEHLPAVQRLDHPAAHQEQEA
ncbi:MAG TPA: oxygenase MpaB family protein, partial [Longimicrobiaceae bacterium]|nr:oxygenase MpaB family protein [Longimicrobiaceae bacterium]